MDWVNRTTPVRPRSISVTSNSLGALAIDSDYFVTYTSAEGAGLSTAPAIAGKVVVNITGKGNYKGTYSEHYYIGDCIDQAVPSIRVTSTTYNGLKQEPEVTKVTWNGKVYNDEQYTVTAIRRDRTDGVTEIARDIALDTICDADIYSIVVTGVPAEGTFTVNPKETTKYTVNPKSIAGAEVSGFSGMYHYMNNAIEPQGIIVTDTTLPVDDSGSNAKRSRVLVKDVDYKEPEFSGNSSPGKATIKISGKGNYTGEVYAYFTIISSDISGGLGDDADELGSIISADGKTKISASEITMVFDGRYGFMTYDGTVRKPGITVPILSPNQYTVTYKNAIEPGTATLIITGNGGAFTGSIYLNYKIKADLSKYGKIAEISDQVYRGSNIAVEPSITVSCAGNVLTSKDYTVFYTNNYTAGKATVTATAASDSYYFNSVSANFTISSSASGFVITGVSSSYLYTGSSVSPEPVVMYNGLTLKKGTDYTVSYTNNINVGTATMTVTGIGSVSGTKTFTYTIEARNISACTADVANATAGAGSSYTGLSYEYNGSVRNPSVTVKDTVTGKTLVKGTDYTVTYSNNVSPGVATVTIKALSKNYTGTKTVTFQIKSAAVSGLKVASRKNHSIKLKWTKQSYADGYQICDNKNRVVATTEKTSYNITKLTSAKTYKFKVRSYVLSDEGTLSYGDFSTQVSAKTMLNTPTLKAQSVNKGQVLLTWSSVSKATSYEIYYSTAADGMYRKLKTVSSKNARRYLDSGLASGEKYFYTIRAVRTVNGSKTYSAYNTVKQVTVR